MESTVRETRTRNLIKANRAEMDYIAEMLRRDIEEFRMLSFNNFGISVFVQPARGALQVFNAKGKWIGFDRYQFDQFSKRPKSMQICFSEEGRVMVWYKQKYRPICSYLKQIESPVTWEQQARWWMANGKKFRLLDLPLELREIVYLQSFGSKVEPYPTHSCRRLGQYTGAILGRKPNFNLLKTCRLVYREASNILFSYSVFRIEHCPVLTKFLHGNPRLPPNHQWPLKMQAMRIKNLELALSDEDFLRLFGLNFGRGIMLRTRPTAHFLKAMKLKRLIVEIPPPSSVIRRSCFDGACQKTLVDWITDAAWPFIRMHPVELTGYVKDSNKARFDMRLNNEKNLIAMWQRQRVAAGSGKGDAREYYDELDEEEGGVSITETERVWSSHEIVSLPLPPPCHCKVPCSLEQWTEKD